jgi:hypothetical protein
VNYIRLDIETVPVPADDPRWLAYIAEDPPAVSTAPERARILSKLRAAGPRPVPANLTDPAKISDARVKRAAEHAADTAAAESSLASAEAEHAAAIEAARKATSLDPLWGRVACIGVGYGDEPAAVQWGANLAMGAPAAEVAALSWLGELLADSGSYLLVGWNIAGFDLPFLRARAIITGCTVLLNALPRIDAKPWEQPVRDLMLMWPTTSRGGRGYVRQKHAARALGLPPQTFGGSMVADALDRGDTAAIVEHCRADVAELLTIGRRMGVLA